MYAVKHIYDVLRNLSSQCCFVAPMTMDLEENRRHSFLNNDSFLITNSFGCINNDRSYLLICICDAITYINDKLVFAIC